MSDRSSELDVLCAQFEAAADAHPNLRVLISRGPDPRDIEACSQPTGHAWPGCGDPPHTCVSGRAKADFFLKGDTGSCDYSVALFGAPGSVARLNTLSLLSLDALGRATLPSVAAQALKSVTRALEDDPTQCPERWFLFLAAVAWAKAGPPSLRAERMTWWRDAKMPWCHGEEPVQSIGAMSLHPSFRDAPRPASWKHFVCDLAPEPMQASALVLRWLSDEAQSGSFTETTDMRATSDPLWQSLRAFRNELLRGGSDVGGVDHGFLFDIRLLAFDAGLRPDAEVHLVAASADEMRSAGLDGDLEGKVKDVVTFFEAGPRGWIQTIDLAAKFVDPVMRGIAIRWAETWMNAREKQLCKAIPALSGASGSERPVIVAIGNQEATPKNILLARVKTAFTEAGGNVSLARKRMAEDPDLPTKIPQSTFYEHLKALDKKHGANWRLAANSSKSGIQEKNVRPGRSGNTRGNARNT